MKCPAHAYQFLKPWQCLAPGSEWPFLVLQKYGKDFSVTNLDKDKQIATLASGKTIHYDALISTMPLDITLTWLGKKQWADGLTHRCVTAALPFSLT